MKKIILFFSCFILILFNYEISYANKFYIPSEIINGIKTGNDEYQYKLGKLYYNHIVHKNYFDKAEYWLTKAAGQNNIPATVLLAVVKKRMGHDNEAFQIYKRVENRLKNEANAGNAEYQVLLGLVYGYGAGVEHNIKIAADWYRKAAEQGHPEGQYYLACRYKKWKWC